MRSLLLGIVGLVWLLLGYWHMNSCCTDTATIGATQNTETDASKAVTQNAAAVKKTGPILFNYDNKTTVLGEDWITYKNNLLSSLKDGELLQITGNYTADEKAPPGFENMGVARADEARKALGLAADKVQLQGVLTDAGVSKTDLYEAVSFRNITVNKSIDESIENKTVIRFPYNSTAKLNDKSVEDYLDKVAKRVIASGEKVNLTGHTDSDGSSESNINLGLRRANIIKAYLVKKGVSAANVMTSSKGEAAPVADNATKEGMALNRRTELEIIK